MHNGRGLPGVAMRSAGCGHALGHYLNRLRHMPAFHIVAFMWWQHTSHGSSTRPLSRWGWRAALRHRRDGGGRAAAPCSRSRAAVRPTCL